MSEFTAKIDEVTGIALEIVVPLSLLQDIQYSLSTTWSEKIDKAIDATEEDKLLYHKQAQAILDLQHEIDKVAGFDVSSS
jgi:hypothetical protein